MIRSSSALCGEEMDGGELAREVRWHTLVAGCLRVTT